MLLRHISGAELTPPVGYKKQASKHSLVSTFHPHTWFTFTGNPQNLWNTSVHSTAENTVVCVGSARSCNAKIKEDLLTNRWGWSMEMLGSPAGSPPAGTGTIAPMFRIPKHMLPIRADAETEWAESITSPWAFPATSALGWSSALWRGFSFSALQDGKHHQASASHPTSIYSLEGKVFIKTTRPSLIFRDQLWNGSKKVGAWRSPESWLAGVRSIPLYIMFLSWF